MSVVEAAYRLDADDEAWLVGVSQAVRPLLDCGLGLIAWYYDARRAGRLRTFGFINLPGKPPSAPSSSYRAGIPLAFVSQVFGACLWRGLAQRDARQVVEVGEREVHLLNAADPTGFGCVLGAPAGGRRGPGVRGSLLWGRLAAHIAAGLRVRRRLLAAAERPPPPEAVVGADGHVHHAIAPANTPRALEALRRAALAADQARGSLRRHNPQRAVALWQGLVDGRWTLLDQFDRGGRRMLVAHRNDPQVPSPRAVSLRERQVLAYAALGHSTKLIAYELGLSVGATSAYLATAMRKLGLRSRMQLVEIAGWGQPSAAARTAAAGAGEAPPGHGGADEGSPGDDDESP